MADLYWKVKTYLEANGKTEDEIINRNVILENVGDGDVIKTWNVSGVSQPNDSQLTSTNTLATKNYNNEIIKNTRKIAYDHIGEQLDLLYKDMAADKGDKTGEWFKAVKKVKDDNPKE